jgi:hypothetical protein
MMTLEVCKYLIKMGADGSGVTESSKSNVLLEALHEKKYKTLMLIKDLPNYDRNPSSEIEMKNKSAFYLSTIQLTPEGSDDTLSYKDFSDLTASFITHGMELDGFMQGPRMFNPIVLIILRYMIEKNESIIEMIRVFLENGASPCVSLENFEEMKVPKENIPDIMTLLLEYKEKTKCE